MGFLIRVLVNAFAIYLIAQIVPGIEVSSLLAALGAGLVLGLINAIVRPILVVLTLPVTLALLVSVVSWILNAFVSDRGRLVVITGRGPADRA